MTDAYYVYAILAPGVSLPAELSGFEGHPVEIIPHGELAAATSVVDPSVLQPTVEAALKHEEVVEKLRESAPLLPVRFGTVFSDSSSVIDVMSSRHDALLADLNRVGDKVEYGLTVLWPEPPADQQVEAPEEIRMPGLNRSSGAEGPGTRYLRARVLEQRRDSALRARARALATLIEAELIPFSLDYRKTILPTPRIAVRAAYLLHPSNLEAYQEAFERTRKSHPDLRFLLNGPWPPYSFVSTSGPGNGASPAGELRSTGPDMQEVVVHG